MPIKKSGGGIVPLKNFYDRTRSIDVDAFPSELHKEWFNTLKELDVASELDWIFSNYVKINSKVVFCLNDMNRKNIIVKDDPMLDWFDRIYLIDSEYATYSPRAKDIMGHFIHRTLDIDSDGIPYSGVAYPSDSQRRHFIETYLSEVKDKDDHLDSFDHIWLECEFYKLGASLSVLFMATALYLQTKPNFLKVAVDYMKMYKEDKRNFLINYGHLLS
ncbi:Choline/ethanolamine kinase [Halotydeus destructor]|nr:Choline/ethanolamine kinase [Halotydeus destructor]